MRTLISTWCGLVLFYVGVAFLREGGRPMLPDAIFAWAVGMHYLRELFPEDK